MAAQVPASESSKSDAETKASSADDENETPPETYYSDLISTLPARGGWVMPLVLYQNYWLNPARLRHIIPVKEHYKPRRDDIILATYPKCGTTWLKALAFAITNRSRSRRGRTSAAADDDHPPLQLIQLHLHPQELVAHLETPNPAARDLAAVEKLPSPRLLATHLPLSLLPPAVSTSGCRVVYLCRQPKDVSISLWYFGNRMLGGTRPPVQLDASVSMFCEGISPFGPFWEHYLEYWKESLARPEQTLFLKYEDIVSDPVRIVEKLAGFFAVPFTEEEKRIGVPEEVVRLCSFEVLSGMESNRSGDVARGDDLVVGKSMFFRKGKVGDWENHMNKEMSQMVDDVIKDKFKGSGLEF